MNVVLRRGQNLKLHPPYKNKKFKANEAFSIANNLSSIRTTDKLNSSETFTVHPSTFFFLIHS